MLLAFGYLPSTPVSMSCTTQRAVLNCCLLLECADVPDMLRAVGTCMTATHVCLLMLRSNV